MKKRSLHVSFEGEDVTIASNDAELLDAVRGIFGPTVISRPKRSIGVIQVLKSARGFTIETRDGAVDVIDTLATLPAHLKHLVHDHFVRSRNDLLWLHAAAVEKSDEAILILGESGQGKSTISTKLVGNGWRLLSDDTAPIRTPSTVLPYYQLPVRRLPLNGEVTPSELRNAPRESIPLQAAEICRVGKRIVRNIFVKFNASGPTELVKIRRSDASLALLEHSVSFHQGHDATLARIAALAESVDSHLLTYSDSDRAVEAIVNA